MRIGRLLSLFWKNKPGLKRSPCCTSVSVNPLYQIWMPEPVFMKLGMYNVPIAVAAPSKAWIAFACSNTWIVCSNPTRGMDVCVYSVFVLFCVSSGLATGWSCVQGILPTVYRIKKLKCNKAFHGCPMLHSGSNRRMRERGIYNVARESIWMAYFINTSHQSVCLYVYVARQLLGKTLFRQRIKRNNRRIDWRVVFYAVRVLSKESLWICLKITLLSLCFCVSVFPSSKLLNGWTKV
jgi:hypothetical protein